MIWLNNFCRRHFVHGKVEAVDMQSLKFTSKDSLTESMSNGTG